MDKMARELGSWKDPRVLMEAGKMSVRKIKAYFSQGITFSQETTLCGNTILNNIEKAKEQGYTIVMYYVGVSSVEIAKKRIQQRVENGGHGIPSADVEKRYVESLKKLKIVCPLCDILELYDNSDVFLRVARVENGVCVERVPDRPLWVRDVLGELS